MERLLIKVGKNHTLTKLKKQLGDFSYERGNLIEPGWFDSIGGIVSINPVNKEGTYKVDFFGSEIERIYLIDPKTGLKLKEIKELEILPNKLFLLDKSTIRPGDYVVHEDYGIGLFSHLEIKTVQNQEIYYIYLEYLNSDRLYLPYEQISKISLYIGVGNRKPKLSKLGTESWQRTFKKTYENIILMAKQLLTLYAQREIINKTSRKINLEWDIEIKELFGFRETEDQTEAIKQCFLDLQKNKPMDRLICGDVGFGKTEVAIRTAAQTITNGHQVAILVPTTILVEQHFATLVKRFRNLPVNIAKLSRFVSETEQSDVIKKVEEGSVDLLVGTHKLLRNNMKFKNLGLLVVDEEQKFGVTQKEKIKTLKQSIDVLTLTATPIPRTLFMSLSGIRDISQINSVPHGRKAIETRVIRFDKETIKEYIKREIERGGQVYYLHNKVKTIEPVRKWLKKEFPKLNIEVAHGQLSEENLADKMRSFTEGKIDVLVCSTIIENGIDLSNVNTLIIEEADKFGLAQLYQIRGRIGRSMRQSYALFTYKNKTITPNAVKRLQSIVENSEIGTGYNIALRDLEIRGEGNILGKDQHGNMEAVGLVLYSKLLKTAVENLKKLCQ